MTVYLQLFCWAAVVFSIGDAADCGPRVVAQLANELGTVDWKTLAGWLDVKQGKVDGIEAKCLRGGGDLAECYRSSLVWSFCESTPGTVHSVREEIVKALENMDKILQASKIRQLDIGAVSEETGSCSSNDEHCTDSRKTITDVPGRKEWEDQEPQEKDLEFFKYRDSNGEVQRFRLLQLIQGKCRAIGTQLGINNPVLKGYEKANPGDQIGFCLEVFDYWSAEGSAEYPFTWGSVVTMMEDIQQKGHADKLKTALSNKV